MRILIEDGAVCFRGREVFAGFQGCFPAGSVSALVGPSGSGKSTVLNVLAGAQRLTRGAVWLEVGGARRTPRMSDVAWVAQEAHLLRSRTVLDNAAIGALSEGADLAASRRRAMEALDMVGMAEAASFPARALSGGEKQRVTFARALASSRPIILADEPSASLDAANTRTIARLLVDLRSAAVVVVATHDPLLMAASDLLVELRPTDETV
ncbi:ABC transporter ATP-binding protein [Leifsonia sp. 21MFCrub1.1]|uniref:ABC transporter ATP-binding protein n=1 Tax=Leifsonia sp. 21MFCrub1.1 TaxID=1798223 RepID=UPI00089299FC|nr:ATP-binding cassette domain-containing protein [Leifsonia sp. 21MFCrub1.1]SEA42332.1 lipoprotein-releasing system ATP-binding protein [Leifsonia sp. 21MFCrub1.1]